MEQVERFCHKIVFVGDSPKNFTPDEDILRILTEDDGGNTVAGDDRVLLAIQDDWREYRESVPAGRRLQFDWSDILERGECTLDQLKALSRMSDREMRSNQIALRLRASRHRTMMGQATFLAPSDLIQLRYLEYEQMPLDTTEMDLPTRFVYYTKLRPIWIRAGLKSMEELEEFVIRKYRFSGPSTKDAIMSSLKRNNPKPGELSKEDRQILDAICREYDLLERIYRKLPDMLLYKFDKRSLLQRADLTHKALMSYLSDKANVHTYSGWWTRLLHSREKGSRIPEEDRNSFAFNICIADMIQIAYITAERDKDEHPQSESESEVLSSDEESKRKIVAKPTSQAGSTRKEEQGPKTCDPYFPLAFVT
jgi:hypothetical protein